jgi:hypothetical protein
VEIDELELQLSIISHNIVVKHINQRARRRRGEGGCVETGG